MEESGWVIEHGDSDGSCPRYFTGFNWSDPGDHQAALRYARECDAQKIAEKLDWPAAHRVREHAWMDDAEVAEALSPRKADNHTPGPWTVDECTTPNGIGYFVSHLWEQDGETHTDEVAEVQMDYRGNRALCNARLLSAAPDLYAACKMALDRLSLPEHEFDRKYTGNTILKLEAAIEKVTGIHQADKVASQVQIYVDGRSFSVANRCTGADIKRAANAPMGYWLFRQADYGRDDRAVADNEAIEPKRGEHFNAVPPATGA